ncbi:unnamed protein product [Spirodela intermedia]|uniref:WRKY domain-containing protein n=1 Tax=Spirodela intermedia TaxID=51605 RepID=A0A7I8LDI9_SPIIN|nr:unnamed protein product [Spirodela intermedia]
MESFAAAATDYTSLNLGLHLGCGGGSKLPYREGEQQGSPGGGALEAELSRMNDENRKLNEKLSIMKESYCALRTQLMCLMSTSPTDRAPASPSGKRKADSFETVGSDDVIAAGVVAAICTESTSGEDDLCKRTREEPKVKISKISVRTSPTDTTLVVKDGYQWRKYGQKITRDNPSPRAYFRCSFAPSCPVKKKVQRSVDDRSILVATYEGEHNHPLPSQPEAAAAATACKVAAPGSNGELETAGHRRIGSWGFHRLLAEQMASSLTKDPDFTAALASAISGKILQL